MRKFKLGWLVMVGLALLISACGSPTATTRVDKVAATKVAEALSSSVNSPKATATPVATATPIAITRTDVAEQLGVELALKPTATPTLPVPVAASSPTPIAFPGKGTVLDRKFHSPILNRDMPFRIYLPPGYANSGKRYPVLYMLHGYSGSYLEWLDYKLFDIADDLISKNQIKPIILVLPSGDQEYWVDHAKGGLQWGQYMAHDVVSFVDTNFRTIPDRESRAIGGHSMGGHGALQLGFNHPDVFGVIGAHSPTLRTKDQAPEFFGDAEWYAAHDPVSLARTAANLNTLKIWVDIGTKDETWRPRVEELHQVLVSRGIAHEWNLFEGDHAGEYWIEHVPDYLKFYTNAVVSS